MIYIILGTLMWMMAVATGFVIGVRYAYDQMRKVREERARMIERRFFQVQKVEK